MEILYPGLIQPQSNDTGLATIGRIDHAQIKPGTLIPMHMHKDDEILTYLRKGKVQHSDSEGTSAIVSNQKLMLMNAGKQFFHQEQVLPEGGDLEGLQIFIRPERAGLAPQVQFHELEEVYSLNQWRKLAGHGSDYPLRFRSNTWLMDLRLEENREISLPDSELDNVTYLLYVFSGTIEVNYSAIVNAGESLMIENEHPDFRAIDTSDLVLFTTQNAAPHFDGGMYSGNLQV